MHLVRPCMPCFQTISLSSDLQEVKISKPHQVFLLNPTGSQYNFHFYDELGGNLIASSRKLNAKVTVRVPQRGRSTNIYFFWKKGLKHWKKKKNKIKVEIHEQVVTKPQTQNRKYSSTIQSVDVPRGGTDTSPHFSSARPFVFGGFFKSHFLSHKTLQCNRFSPLGLHAGN